MGSRLLRRVPRGRVHNGTCEGSNFREDEPGRGLSVTLWETDQDLADVRRFNEDFGVIAVPAEIFRDAGVRIVRVPLVGNLNHCEIFPRLSPSPQKKLRTASRWVFYPDWVLQEHRQALDTLN